jgi:hypothetical protein
MHIDRCFVVHHLVLVHVHQEWRLIYGISLITGVHHTIWGELTKLRLLLATTTQTPHHHGLKLIQILTLV